MLCTGSEHVAGNCFVCDRVAGDTWQPLPYHNCYEDQAPQAAALSRLQREKPRPRPNIGRWAGRCDQCKADCFEDHLGDVICSECGLIKEDSGRILEHPIKWDSGRTPAVGGSEDYPDEGDLDYSTVIKGLNGAFLGEKSLTAVCTETTREADVILHHCPTCGKIYLARTVWWTNPKNGNGKHWLCLSCQKDAGVIDAIPQWTDEDVNTIREIIKIQRKYWVKCDYHSFHHRAGNCMGVYAQIKQYLNRVKTNSDPETGKSFFQYQKVLKSDRYLKTAVLTLLWLRAAGKYARLAAATIRPKPKGGRRPSGGAKAVSNWCARCRFTKEIPIKQHRADENNLQYGVISESFDDQNIEPILKELDERNIKYCFRHLKSIADMGV